MSDFQYYMIYVVITAIYLIDWHYERKIIRETKRLQDLVEEVLNQNKQDEEQ